MPVVLVLDELNLGQMITMVAVTNICPLLTENMVVELPL